MIVDDSGRVGPLSYLVSEGVTIDPGTAVHVPFGKRELHGMVLGPGDPKKATREVIRSYGVRATPTEIAVAAALAARHFSTLAEVAGRLSPSSGRGAEALDAGELRLVHEPLELPRSDQRARLLLASPLEDHTELAAAEVARMLRDDPKGQVLVLCPTRALVEQTLSRFASGAVRLDAQAPAGAWAAFIGGNAPVGVGSRVSAMYSAARLGGIVVLEADHPGHRESAQPYWDCVEVARERAAAHGCALSLLSAAPTLRSLKGVKVVASLHRRTPRVQLVDLSAMTPGSRLAPPQLLAAATRGRRAGIEVLAITTGGSERVCVRCRTPRPCSQCSSSGCSHREQEACAVCSSIGVRWSGLSPELAARRHDADRVVTLDDAASMSRAPRTVLVPNADRFLVSSSIDGDAYAFRNLVRLARLAGDGGELVLCTNMPHHPALRALRALDPSPLLKSAWSQARQLRLPPHTGMLTVRMNHEKPPQLRNAPGTVFGPRRRGREWEFLLTFDHADHAAVSAFVTKLRRRGKVRVALQ